MKKRANGEGMIRRRKDGRWEGRILVGYKDNGSPMYHSVYAKTQEEVMIKHQNQINLYRGAELSEKSGITLAQWLEEWLAQYVRSAVQESTLCDYTLIVQDYIDPQLGNRKISSITTADVQRMYNYLRQNGRKEEHAQRGYSLSGSFIRNIHNVLHQAMDVACIERLVAKNPTEGTVLPGVNCSPKQILNEEQVEKFLEEIAEEPDWHVFFYTAITTGLRRGELCGLQWRDLDERTGQLSIRRSIGRGEDKQDHMHLTKTEAGLRTFVLPQSTLILLIEHKRKSNSQWIFPNLKDPARPMSPKSAYDKLKEILRNGKLPDIRFHDLRHTFATHALSSGVDAKTLSQILGHTNPSFTLDTYAHVTTDMHKAAADIVGEFLEQVMAI